MAIRYYDKDGSPMEMMEWGDKKQINDPEYKRVAETTLTDGTWISTVWVGLDMQFGDGPPLIFETMVFLSKDNLDEQDMDRYSTLEEAMEGHDRMVKQWKETQDGNNPA